MYQDKLLRLWQKEGLLLRPRCVIVMVPCALSKTSQRWLRVSSGLGCHHLPIIKVIWWNCIQRAVVWKIFLVMIAVDVSSNWKRFPRYGFVADFDNYSSTVDKNANIKSEMAYLNRLHINGVQFQDWQWMHHRPVKLNGDGLLTQWYTDISNRWVGVEYVKNYIATQTYLRHEIHLL